MVELLQTSVGTTCMLGFGGGNIGIFCFHVVSGPNPTLVLACILKMYVLPGTNCLIIPLNSLGSKSLDNV